MTAFDKQVASRLFTDLSRSIPNLKLTEQAKLKKRRRLLVALRAAEKNMRNTPVGALPRRQASDALICSSRLQKVGIPFSGRAEMLG